MAPRQWRERTARWLLSALCVAALAGCTGPGGDAASAEAIFGQLADRLDDDSRFQLALTGSLEDALALFDKDNTLARAKELGLLMPPTHDWAGIRSGYLWSGTDTGYDFYTAENGVSGLGGYAYGSSSTPGYDSTFGPVRTDERDNDGGGGVLPWQFVAGPPLWDWLDDDHGGGGPSRPVTGGGGGLDTPTNVGEPVPTPSAAVLAGPLMAALAWRRKPRVRSI